MKAYPAQVAQLIEQQRYQDAAQLLEQQGDRFGARELYAQACDFANAARVATLMDDPVGALLHCAEGNLEVTAALDALDPQRAELAAYRLQTRGFFEIEGALRERMNDANGAAAAYERAGSLSRAAAVLERAGQWAQAGRLLESAWRRTPNDTALAVQLGRILLQCGKTEAAVRVLQKVGETARERRDALTLLLSAYERLGLHQAHAETQAEVQRYPAAPHDALELPASVAPRAHDLLFGRYASLETVHESANARVLRCTDTLRDDQVALKIFVGRDLHGTGRDALVRFEREVQALRALEHPHVVRPRDYLGEGPAVVTEWMAQGSLEQLLRREPITPRRAVEIALAVLGALGQAHTLGILHRDVKPANVLFDAAGTPKLADFGVAHLGDLSSTVTAGFIGTFAYMSPEQRRGQRAGVPSDLYGVGAMLLEMLTGAPPAPDEPYAPPSDFHRELTRAHDAAVARLLAAEPADRPQSAAIASAELSALRWPVLVDRAPVRAIPEARPSGQLDDGRRYVVDETGQFVCARSGRAVERVKLEGADDLTRAQLFAQCNHRAVQAVLTATAKELWLERPRGARLDRPLTSAEAARLGEALAALHARGFVHGAIDAEHILATAVGPVLRYAAAATAHDVNADRYALARLTARSAG